MCHTTLVLHLFMALAGSSQPDVGSARSDPRQPLQPFNDLIGSWRATGIPEGTPEQKRNGFWTESLAWEWQFKKDGPSLVVAFDKGKHFQRAALRHLADAKRYQLVLTDLRQQDLVFEGSLKDRVLTVSREEPTTLETQRLVVTLLHDNRFLYRYEICAAGQTRFKRVYQVGATKEGVPFAGPGDTQPECIVSGGLGTIRVSYQGKDYYVCCSGCRDAFKEEPEKYVREYKAKKKK